MGITGLIAFCQAATRPSEIREFKGSCVAIDSYCFLHKGAYSCSDKLIKGIKTSQHIDYCMKFVKMLLSQSIRPIMVFDGRNLPAKAETEAKRRKDRDTAKLKAKEFLRAGKTEEARKEFVKGVDITHEHAIELMQACRKVGVDCITAMYEADSQLAYLNKICIADYVISEDSDLILFGCNKIIFKLQLDGTCLLFDSEKLHMCLDTTAEKFDFVKFRRICILSGCDYLSSLHGIGLAKARKFMTMTEESDMKRALMKIPSYLNMKKLTITDEYIEGFLKAEATFKHMFVFDPLKQEMLRLNPLETDTEIEHCSNAGELLEPKVAYQLALGNLNPKKLFVMENFDPDIAQPMAKVRKHPSIWSRSSSASKSPFKARKQQSNISNFFTSRVQHKPSAEVQQIIEEENNVTTGIEIDELMSSYCITEVVTSKRRNSDHDHENSFVSHSPNPFAKRHQPELTKTVGKPSLLELLSNKNVNEAQPSTVTHRVFSRFFPQKFQDNPSEMEDKLGAADDNDQDELAFSITQLREKLSCHESEGTDEPGSESSNESELPETEETMLDTESNDHAEQENIFDSEEVLPPEKIVVDVIQDSENIIDLDSFEIKEKVHKQAFIKPKPILKPFKMKLKAPSQGKSKANQNDGSIQTKLSKFGFQKKTTL